MNSIIDDEFRRYLQIDKNALDDELISHPQLLFRVSEAYVEAVAERDALKENLLTVDASLDQEIRGELEGGKVTEAIVKNLIQLHPKHKAASDAYLMSKHKADVLAALKDAFGTRGYMLRDLCQLYTANYFENSSVKDSAAADAATYRRNRQRLAEARERRK